MSASARRSISLDGAVWLAGRALGLLQRDHPSVFTLADFDIDLPPADGESGDADALRLVTPMYLACELQQAGLLDALETLAGLYVAGGITANVGPAGQTLAAVWRSRNQTISAEERVAFCQRVFMPAEGETLNGALVNLCDAIIVEGDTHPSHGRPRASARIGLAIRSLTAVVLPRARGVPPVAVRELLSGVELALQVFGAPEVRSWLGARSTWGALEAMNERLGSVGRPDVRSLVDRAKSGAVVLGWAADVLASTGPIVRVPAPVADAAHEWIDATRALLDVEAA